MSDAVFSFDFVLFHFIYQRKFMEIALLYNDIVYALNIMDTMDDGNIIHFMHSYFELIFELKWKCDEKIHSSVNKIYHKFTKLSNSTSTGN